MLAHGNMNKCKYIETRIDDTKAIITIITQTKKKQDRICNKQTCICVVKFATVSAKR